MSHRRKATNEYEFYNDFYGFLKLQRFLITLTECVDGEGGKNISLKGISMVREMEKRG